MGHHFRSSFSIIIFDREYTRKPHMIPIKHFLYLDRIINVQPINPHNCPVIKPSWKTMTFHQKINQIYNGILNSEYISAKVIEIQGPYISDEF